MQLVFFLRERPIFATPVCCYLGGLKQWLIVKQLLAHIWQNRRRQYISTSATWFLHLSTDWVNTQSEWSVLTRSRMVVPILSLMLRMDLAHWLSSSALPSNSSPELLSPSRSSSTILSMPLTLSLLMSLSLSVLLLGDDCTTAKQLSLTLQMMSQLDLLWNEN